MEPESDASLQMDVLPVAEVPGLPTPSPGGRGLRGWGQGLRRGLAEEFQPQKWTSPSGLGVLVEGRGGLRPGLAGRDGAFCLLAVPFQGGCGDRTEASRGLCGTLSHSLLVPPQAYLLPRCTRRDFLNGKLILGIVIILAICYSLLFHLFRHCACPCLVHLMNLRGNVIHSFRRGEN